MDQPYTTNDLNQYTATAAPAESFGYDADGNLLSDAPAGPKLVAAKSYKTHGAAGEFYIDLPLASPSAAGIECRNSGPTTIELEFSEEVTIGTGNLVLSSGTCSGVTQPTAGVAKYRVAMSGATANACLSIMLKDVTAKTTGRPLVGTAAVYVVALLGDVNADGTVANPADYNYAYGFNNLVTNQSNCRCDLDMTGRIGSGDYTIIAGNLNATASCTLPPAVLGLAYTWDAENRLTQVVTRRDPTGTFYLGDTKVEFKYDYMSRRIEKKYSIYTGSAWTLQYNQRFIYDGWNPVLVLDGASSNAVKIKYTWGLDLSGSVQGAGGIGGRLALDTTVSTKCSGRWPAGIARSSRQGLAAQDLRSGTKNYWFLYDANGNVGQVLDATNLSAITTAARYEYDPYGNTLSATGTYAAANPFRFSTKWFDTETGLSYYGYRYYSERLGRWMSRDPATEIAGMNLLAFVENGPLAHFDPFGLWAAAEHKSLTANAFNAQINTAAPRVTVGCRDHMLEVILDGNLSQDFITEPQFNQGYRHYNRDFNPKETPADKDAADGDYAYYLAGEWDALLDAWPDCDAGLLVLGRMTHTWQDFFMHAIRRDGLGGKELSTYPGWTAWTASPPVTGDPDNRQAFWPSSYNSATGVKAGEHPNRGEPVGLNSAEGKARYSAAAAYTSKELGVHMYEWLHDCACDCNKAH